MYLSVKVSVCFYVFISGIKFDFYSSLGVLVGINNVFICKKSLTFWCQAFGVLYFVNIDKLPTHRQTELMRRAKIWSILLKEISERVAEFHNIISAIPHDTGVNTGGFRRSSV